MCKIEEFVDSLNRAELLKNRDLTQARLKIMQPVRIMAVHKRCSKSGCSCQLDDDQRHGPYLVATFSADGKQRQKNLGKKYLEPELNSMAQDEAPKWTEYIVENGKLIKVKEFERYANGLAKGWLDLVEFQNFYGISVDDDRFGRDREPWYSRRNFDAAMSKWNESQDVSNSEFRTYGVGTAKGVAILRGLLTQGYYLAN